jgi:hypothetical protein
MEPYHSIDLTELVRQVADTFVVLRSPSTATDTPSYRVVMEFPTQQEAEAFAKYGGA